MYSDYYRKVLWSRKAIQKVWEKTHILKKHILREWSWLEIHSSTVEEWATTGLFSNCGDSVIIWIKENCFFEELWTGNYWQESILLKRNSIAMMISNEYNKWGTNLEILYIPAKRQSSFSEGSCKCRNLLWRFLSFFTSL